MNLTFYFSHFFDFSLTIKNISFLNKLVNFLFGWFFDVLLRKDSKNMWLNFSGISVIFSFFLGTILSSCDGQRKSCTYNVYNVMGLALFDPSVIML